MTGPRAAGARLAIRVEGWRLIPHSYAIVNEFQCLELLRRRDVQLSHRDAPFFNAGWSNIAGLLPEAKGRLIRELDGGIDGADADVVYRISFPMDFRPIPQPLFVFATCETGHGLDEVLGGRTLVEAQRAAGATIVTPSNWSRNGFIRLGIRGEDVRVVPHGIDPAICRPYSRAKRERLREKAGLGQRFVFLSVGAMTANKGIGLLLRAFAEVARRRPEAVLILKGMDALYTSRQFLNYYLREGRVGDVMNRIRYIGEPLSFQAMADLYNAADAYVAPYRAEGFALPALEAAACGLPVIATAGGPTDDFLDDSFALRIRSTLREWREEGSGPVLTELLPDGDHLAELMRKVLEEEGWRRSAQRAAADHVGERFTWSTAVDRLLALLREP